MILGLYRAAATAAEPLVRLYLAGRKMKGKEDSARIAERFGRTDRPRPHAKLVWIHAASVGESLSAVPLIERLLSTRSGLVVLLTTGTVTSARLMGERLPVGAFHQYVPVDRPAYVRRFLDHWRPDLALWVESEFWPNLVLETAARNTPLVLINGRISPKSFAGWQRFPSAIARILSAFDVCLGQSADDADRLRRLGAPRVRCHGNLKFVTPPLPAGATDLERLREILGGRPVWLAASTHMGEEEIAGDVHRELSRNHPHLLTIIVPRHPERGREIAHTLEKAGFSIALRSRGDAVAPSTALYVADTMGELGLFYRLSSIAFVGKSLVPFGGQNPLEAARLDCAVLFGPYMNNFAEIARGLVDAGAAEEVPDRAALALAVGRLLADASLRQQRSAAARRYAESQSGVLDAVLGEVLSVLDRNPLESSPRADARVLA